VNLQASSRRRFLKIAAAGAIVGAASVFGGLEVLGYFNQTATTSTGCQTVHSSETMPNTDASFFIDPYQNQMNRLVDWLNTPWQPAAQGFGFDSTFQLVRGGYWPGYNDSGLFDSQGGRVFPNGYHPGMVLIDSNFILAKTLDFFNQQSGRTPSTVYNTCRNYLGATTFVNPAAGASPDMEAYNGFDRREIFLGKTSPFYGEINAVYQTASQIWYVPGHTLSSSNPIVTALPTVQVQNPTTDIEFFAPRILLEYLNDNISQAKSDFLSVINSWQPGCPGQIGAPFGGFYTSRCLSFTIAVARSCKDVDGTPFWALPGVQPIVQQIIESLWAIQQPDGGIPTSYYPAAGETPESTGEALLAFDPTLPSRFS
jgi:hypothetical protein